MLLADHGTVQDNAILQFQDTCGSAGQVQHFNQGQAFEPAITAQQSKTQILIGLIG